MQVMKMSRESRKVFQTIDDLCVRNKMQGEITPASIYMCDMLLIRFYAQPICNILRGQIGRLKKKESKHFTFDYWVPVIVNMLKNNQSAVKPNATIPDWKDNMNEKTIESFTYIIQDYIITDYGYDDMVLIQKIVNTYTYGEIIYGCMIGKSNKVYEPRYLNAVLEKEKAKQDIKDQQLQALHSRTQSSDKLLHTELHEHTPLELAMIEYNWKQKRENARLQREFDNIIRRMNK